jgi:hypothetical protein
MKFLRHHKRITTTLRIVALLFLLPGLTVAGMQWGCAMGGECAQSCCGSSSTDSSATDVMTKSCGCCDTEMSSLPAQPLQNMKSATVQFSSPQSVARLDQLVDAASLTLQTERSVSVTDVLPVILQQLRSPVLLL